MTISEALDRADRMRPNAVHYDDKKRSLWKLETQFAEMIGDEIPDWTNEEEDYELLIPAPYDQSYVYHLMAFIDHAQEETDLYMIDSAMANQETKEAMAWYRRNVRQHTDTRFRGVFI